MLLLIVVILLMFFSFFFFNDTATTEIYTLSLHDALPILRNGFDGGSMPPSKRQISNMHAECGGGDGAHWAGVGHGFSRPYGRRPRSVPVLARWDADRAATTRAEDARGEAARACRFRRRQSANAGSRRPARGRRCRRRS